MTPGTRLGPYEILAPLGAGGMGDVYRARDTRLDRIVAIKVLSAALAGDPQFRERFDREARTISALTHPHICALYDVGHTIAPAEPGSNAPRFEIEYLVMEYVEGETLAARLERDALKIDEALKIAIEIAGALDSAHRAGIVHRDLKPGNIMLTRSGAKLLDFGLAKRPAAVVQGFEATALPTTPPGGITARGTILGTLQYMSPEQIEGREADARTDIFAFGLVLYEMVTGRKAFTGQTHAGLISAILKDEPPAISALRPVAPRTLDGLVRRCLAQHPDERWQSVRDLQYQLTAIRDGAGSPATISPAPLRVRQALPWIVLSAVAGAAIGAAAIWSRAPRDSVPAAPVTRFSIALPANESIDEYNSVPLALSRDGRRIAYTATRNDGRGLYVRALDELTSKWLAGTERAANPFFSPDGRWIGFEAGGMVKKISLDGGGPQTICEAPYFTGATWTTDDTIVFTPIFTSGLWRVPAGGHRPVRVTTPDGKKNERGHVWPDVLPGGKDVLFTIWTGGAFDESRIAVASVETGAYRVVIESGFYGRYAPSGHIVYARGRGLMAAPFDLQKMTVTGPSVPILDAVSGDDASGATSFAVSASGSLVYVTGARHGPLRTLTWVDRQGRPQPLTAPKRPYAGPRVSPDGRRLGLYLETPGVDVWVYELSRSTLAKVTFVGGDNHSAAWSPDSKRVAFESSRTGVHHLYIRRSDGTGAEDQMTSGEYDQYLSDWSRDGSYLIYTELHADTGLDLWTVDTATRQTRPFVQTPFLEKEAVFSPDGHWVAYVSNESGENEVYVQPFPGPGEKIPISVGGGEEPTWAASGRELFFRNVNRMMAVPITTTPSFAAGKPALLFEAAYHYNIVPNRAYDVAPDGRFIMIKEDHESSPRQFNVVLNWAGDLKRRVAVR